MSILDIAVQKEPIATPASIKMVKCVWEDFFDIKYAIDTVMIPPINDAMGNILKPHIKNGIPVINTIVAASDEPEATPMRYGSARGFLKRP